MKLIFSFGLFYLIRGSLSISNEYIGTLQQNINANLDISTGFIQKFSSPSLSFCGALCAATFSCISAEFNSIGKRCELFLTRKLESRSVEKRMYSIRKECPSWSDPIAGLCVEIIESPKRSHAEAESYCQEKRGHLLSIYDDFTRNEVLTSVSHSPSPNRYWVNGQRVEGTNVMLDWRGMEIPLVDNDPTSSDQHCALISKYDIYTQDWVCEYSEMFICQY